MPRTDTRWPTIFGIFASSLRLSRKSPTVELRAADVLQSRKKEPTADARHKDAMLRSL